MIKHYKYFKEYEVKQVGKKVKYDNNIYTFDIETTSYFILNGKVHNSLEYDYLSEDERRDAIPMSTMYIWMLGINKQVYYGRTWDDLIEFLDIIESVCDIRKIIYVHNLAFEFQYLMSVLEFETVFARKSRKPLYAICKDFNIEFRCSLFMSNTKLENLPGIYNLKTQKLVGNLDYNKIRHSKTKLTFKEFNYCENDCIILYEYIIHQLEYYKYCYRIPITSTGFVRREFQEKISRRKNYRSRTRSAINTNPHVYNMLVSSFMGGFTHANWVHADEIKKQVSSFDETSAYPYVMTTYKFPSTEFKKCYIKSVSEMKKEFAYLLHVRFTNVKSKFYNNFISGSKCLDIKGAKYDNGRIISAESFEMILTDVDFKVILKSYSCEYEILESYFSYYNYLPRDFILFILEKYVTKTEYKGIEEKSLEYNLEKQKFNALYGMSVTNTIGDKVELINNIWVETPLTNEEILERLEKEKNKAFLSFAWGVWVTAWARKILLERIMELDEYLIYADTDSLKLLPGYDETIIENYNKSVLKRIDIVSKKLNIPIEKYMPKDIKGVSHPLGLFEFEETYDEFITQGAKKYATKTGDKIKITVAGVPKTGASALKSLKEFKDGLVFKFKDTKKNLLFYSDFQESVLLKDYLGVEMIVSDKTGCCLLPNTYTLGKSYDYMNLLSDETTKRAIYKER